MTAGRDRQFGPWTGPLVAPLSTRSLIDSMTCCSRPSSASTSLTRAKHKDPLTGERYARAGEDWSAEEAEQIMSPHTRAIAAKWRALCDAPASDGGYDGAQPPTIVQAATIDHAGALADAFRRAARSRPGMEGGTMSQPRESRGDPPSHLARPVGTAEQPTNRARSWPTSAPAGSTAS